MSANPIVSYIRVSTSGQGRSGLGIEAQRQNLSSFAQTEGFTVAGSSAVFGYAIDTTLS